MTIIERGIPLAQSAPNSPKPKLMIFSHLCSSKLITGGEKVLSLMMRELVKHYECLLVVPTSGIIAHHAQAIGIRTVVLDIPLCPGLLSCINNLEVQIENLKAHPGWGQLNALLAYERPDVVFVNTSVHPLPAIAAHSRGIPTVWLVMEMLYDNANRKKSAAFIANHCDVLVGMSQAVLKPFRFAKNIKQYVLPPYLEQSELAMEVWPEARKQLRELYRWDDSIQVVGFIAATIYPNKGQQEFINAMLPIAAAHPNTRFLIVGLQTDEDHYRACKASVTEAGCENRFIFYPFVQHIHQVYPAIDIVVVPSLVPEGFGMTALEGMMFGKPVVAYASGGLEEILNATGNERFLVQRGDTRQLTERVKWLANDIGYQRTVGKRNIDAAMKVFGVEREAAGA
jgi:glycosyltransferase involved in cell wall biosynthesis